MKTPPKLYYGLNNQNPNILASYFLQDKNQLINEAEQILGDKFSGYSDFVVVFHIMKFSSLKRKIITHCFY